MINAPTTQRYEDVLLFFSQVDPIEKKSNFPKGNRHLSEKLLWLKLQTDKSPGSEYKMTGVNVF